MRVLDAVTDPFIGALMDRTNGKFGKFRPFMVIGNAIMAVSVLLMYVLTPFVPESMMWLRYAAVHRALCGLGHRLTPARPPSPGPPSRS